jgi:hypothetical protein
MDELQGDEQLMLRNANLGAATLAKNLHNSTQTFRGHVRYIQRSSASSSSNTCETDMRVEKESAMIIMVVGAERAEATATFLERFQKISICQSY